MRQMINSMSTKLEIGSPMASLYILGNPDHYKSHQFVNFAWRSYVSFVKNYWLKKTGFNEIDDPEDLMTVRKVDGNFEASSVVDDYRFRPLVYERVTLYEWVQCSEKKARNRKEIEAFEEECELRAEFDAVQSHNVPPSDPRRLPEDGRQ
ncbi:hypothetical protein C8R43DRAFT_876637 [Mycena crocata]|nr:hypothetical protein C8R43DRAFT_876637 [Mycena crocata]